jgi:hypothetical protein
MDASRVRILLASGLALSLLSAAWALPVAAAECALSAPATGRVGTILTITGSGFPGSSSIDIELTIDGGNADEFTVQSNASGAFEFTFTPEPIDEGDTTVVARSGSTCSAQVQFTILGANDPVPTAEPGEAGAAPSTAPDAPRTDAAPLDPGEAPAGAGWLAGTILLVLGVVGLLGTRSARGRSDR